MKAVLETVRVPQTETRGRRGSCCIRPVRKNWVGSDGWETRGMDSGDHLKAASIGFGD